MKTALRLSERFDPTLVGKDGVFQRLDSSAADQPGALIYAAQVNFLNAGLANENVSAFLVPPDLEERVKAAGKSYVVSPTPRLEFFRLYQQLHVEGWLEPEWEPSMGVDCRIHPDATVSPKVRLGDRVVIEAGARIGDHCVIGDDAYIGQNAVIGADGLMPVIDEEGNALRFSHAGSVLLGDRVVVLAGTCIVKSVFGRPTTIGSDSYVGLLTNIGHDVSIGRRCVVGGNCVLAGASVLEDGAEVWASTSVAQGTRIKAGAKIHMGSVVVQTVEAGEAVSGNYAYNHRKRALDHLRKTK
ncbi:MAG: hypothetical protein KDN19_07910 [Verrucomicrobiae bacterium]|nr:hypothetical protein [Verrucomicrobiae bacterium]